VAAGSSCALASLENIRLNVTATINNLRDEFITVSALRRVSQEGVSEDKLEGMCSSRAAVQIAGRAHCLHHDKSQLCPINALQARSATAGREDLGLFEITSHPAKDITMERHVARA
jgi:hypothetical protein